MNLNRKKPTLVATDTSLAKKSGQHLNGILMLKKKRMLILIGSRLIDLKNLAIPTKRQNTTRNKTILA
jgi:hypothetical protein